MNMASYSLVTASLEILGCKLDLRDELDNSYHYPPRR